MPIYFQSIQGVSAIQSGVKFIALIIPQTIATIIVGGLITRFGYYVRQIYHHIKSLQIADSVPGTLHDSRHSSQRSRLRTPDDDWCPHSNHSMGGVSCLVWARHGFFNERTIHRITGGAQVFVPSHCAKPTSADILSVKMTSPQVMVRSATYLLVLI